MRFLCVAAGRRSLTQLLWTREGRAGGTEARERRRVSSQAQTALLKGRSCVFHRYEAQQVRRGPKRLSSDRQQDDPTVSWGGGLSSLPANLCERNGRLCHRHC